jgi:tRNA (pseudouridine54-N1)-methyltransferase
MTVFAVVGHTAITEGNFTLNDMPGSAGRMDVLCRCVNAALFLSHDLRRDAGCYLVLCGPPNPPRTILFSGDSIRSLNPDERSAGALIRKALSVTCGREFRESTRGVSIRRGGLPELLDEHAFAVLDEAGDDIRGEPILPEALLLSDHQNLTAEECDLTAGCPRYSVGPLSLHADHAITVFLNERDRRCCR